MLFVSILPFLGCAGAVPAVQQPLVPEHIYDTAGQHLRVSSGARPLHGRFLHITGRISYSSL